jgi:hypothetical protein
VTGQSGIRKRSTSLLTSEDTTPAELAAAIHAYMYRQAAVEQAVEQHVR